MDYPIWYIPGIGGAVVIATIAVLHVFISHFAVGMGLYVALAERKAIKDKDEKFRYFVKKGTLLILLVSAVLGAVTGVGIWFSIALVSPAGTSSLIHIFVWGWASEWVFFALEIVALLTFYYTWGKVSDKTHQFIAWLYFIGAWMSLFIINGIITFQLTPGEWIQTRSFWDGFFNPTFWPSVVGRTGIALLLAGVYAAFLVAFTKDKELKTKAGRFTGWFILVGAAMSFAGMYWWSYAIPEDVREQFFGGNSILSDFYVNSYQFLIATSVLALIFTLILPRLMNAGIAALVFVIAFASFGYYEFTRERVRKPFVIRDYMYSNGILVEEVDKLNEEGILSKAKWANYMEYKDPVKIGEGVFKAECNICHDMHNFNNLYQYIEGSSAEDIYDMVQYMGENPLMPPFIGTDEELQALSKYLEKEAN